MADCGSHKGIKFVRHRLCDMFPRMDRLMVSRWYFVYIDGEPTGDHFKTLQEVYDHIDNEITGKLEEVGL